MPALTRAEAETRAAAIRVQSYTLDLDLTLGEEEFGSRSAIQFTATPGAETFVELKPVAVRSATLNGRDLDPAALDDNRLLLTGLAEANELVIECTMAYSHTGEGLHRYVDPADKEVYLYAQTFLDDAQRVFACFDQPDLKAPFTLRITAPPAWTVLSNGAGEQTAPGRWEFATTKPLATYFFTVCAGPYHGVRGEHDGIPLGLWARKSLGSHLDREAPQMLVETGQCFDYYHANFGARYPFGKYDQVFVPEFNAGAMENPGCVTFRDEYIFTSAATATEREERAMVIAHEMAHMWFGDLVTMRWWDDLWLNESFAEYMGSQTLTANTQWTQAWTSFAVSRKTWGYNTDQTPSTHPVAPESVDNTALALLNFDGISYAKGASVLRQLVAWLGEDVFYAGLRDHFQAHQYGNATLADLLDSLQKASGRDLSLWADLWLRRAQVNTLELAIEPGPDAARMGPVIVVQTAEKDFPTLRPHKINLGLYDLAGDALVRRDLVPIEIAVTGNEPGSGADTPVPELDGARRPDLMVLNDGDLTFAKVRLDGHSLTHLPDTLPRLTDPLTRAVIWNSLLRSVRDAVIPGSAVISLVAAALPTEPHIGVIGDVLQLTIGRAQGQRQVKTSVLDGFMDPSRYEHGQELIYAAVKDVLFAEPAGGPRQLVTARALIAATETAAEQELLRDWLAGRGVPDGLAIDQQLRWQILCRLSALGAADRPEIDAEHANDRTAEGEEWSHQCRAALLDPAAKAASWEALINDDSLSNRQLSALATGFWQPGAAQAAITEPYVARYFAEIPEMAKRRTQSMAWQTAFLAFPAFAVSPATLDLAETMLARDDLKPSVRRVVVDFASVTRRLIAARALDAAALPA